MAGILSSNANLDDFGFASVIRDLERHQLILDGLGLSTGDNVNQSTVTPSQNGSPVLNLGSFTTGSGAGSPGTGGGTSVGYIGTLNLPIFGGSTTVLGNNAGQYAVDWQQYRTSVTQVASGKWATISGGLNNTASGQYSTVVGGWGNLASGSSSIAGGSFCTASGGGSVALGAGSTASNSNSVALGLSTASGQNAFAALNATASGDSSCSIGTGVVSVAGSYGFGRGAGISSTPGIATGIVNIGTGFVSLAGAVHTDAVFITTRPVTTSGTGGFNYVVINPKSTIDLSTSAKVLINCASDGAATNSPDVAIACGYSNSKINICVNGNPLGGWTGALVANVCLGGSTSIQNGFACNGKDPQTPVSGASLAVAASPVVYNQASDQLVRTLVDKIRQALFNNGIMS